MEDRRKLLKQGLEALLGVAAVRTDGPHLSHAQESSPDYLMIIDPFQAGSFERGENNVEGGQK